VKVNREIEEKKSQKRKKEQITMYDALPYIDAKATLEIEALIQLNVDKTSDPHPRLPPLPEPHFSPAMMEEFERVKDGKKLDAIDLSRYTPSSEREWCITHEIMHSRFLSLELLEKHGQAAWLRYISGLEAQLLPLEQEIQRISQETNQVNVDRKRSQLEAKERLDRLEGEWRALIGKTLQVEAANEMLKRNVR